MLKKVNTDRSGKNNNNKNNNNINSNNDNDNINNNNNNNNNNNESNLSEFNLNSESELKDEYNRMEVILQKYEGEVRTHIRTEQQLKIYVESL